MGLVVPRFLPGLDWSARRDHGDALLRSDRPAAHGPAFDILHVAARGPFAFAPQRLLGVTSLVTGHPVKNFPGGHSQLNVTAAAPPGRSRSRARPTARGRSA